MNAAPLGAAGGRYAGQQYVMKLWTTTTHASADNLAQQASLRQVMVELSSMTEHRRVRLLESRTAMPTIYGLSGPWGE